MPVTDVNGRVLSGVEDNLTRCQQRLHSVLNRPDPEGPERSLTKNANAPGAVGICAQLLKAQKSLTPAILLKIFHDIWLAENVPDDWKTGLIVGLAIK